MNASGTARRGQNANQNIQVYVRVRPTNNREKTIRSQEVIDVPKPEVRAAISKQVIARQLLDSNSQKRFTFDRAFGTDSTQKEVYETVVKPLIEEVLAGYNCTVFAYGQTGTGKTFTMVGEEAPELGLSWEDDGPIGIIPRALSHLFDELRAMDMEFSMRVSYLELYNEELCDLLSTDDSVKIRIYDDSTKKGSVIVQGLEEIPVHNKDDVYKLLAKGQERRRTASTLMNAQSSRSHTVFSILVHIRENGIDGEEMLKIGKLNLVDLAGSENISKAGNEKGIRTRETVNINQSLLTLGRVITALVEKTPHIPYRESKLTRLLQESLGGRTKTSIIATISPGHKDLEETLSTLDYAHRAKNIQNRPEINQRLTKKTVLKEYTEEIDRLKRDLMASRDKNGIYLAQETYEDMVFKIENTNKELTDKHDKIKALKEELARQMTLFEEISLNLIERTEQLERTDEKLKLTETALELKRKNLKKAKKCYEEKKALLSQHIRTEEILTEQARDLIATAEIASTDTQKLHESIDRHKAVEHSVETSCQKFTQRLQSDLNQANDTLSKFHENFESTSKKIGTGIQTFTKEQTNLSTCLLTLLKAVDAMGDDRSSAMRTQLETTEAKFNEKSAECTRETTKFSTNLVTFAQTSNSKIQEIVVKGFESFQAQLNAISETQKQIIDSVRARDVEFNTFTTSLEQQLAAITTQTQDIEAEYQKLAECQTLFTALSTRMGSHLSSLHAHQNKVAATVENSTHTLNTFKQTSFMADQNDFHEKMETLVEEISTDAERCWEKHIVEADSVRKNVETRVDCYTKMHSQLLGTELARNLKENHEKLAKMDEASNVALHQKCTELNTEVERVGKSVMDHAGQNASLMKATEVLTKTVTSELKAQMRQISDATEYFRREEVKSYMPTGETPARKEYKIERDLAQTLPHERIIRKFRLDRNADLDSSVFSEADDDCSMLSETQADNACLLINSTPFKDGVTERKNLSEPHLSQILTLSAISEEDKENFESH